MTTTTDGAGASMTTDRYICHVLNCDCAGAMHGRQDAFEDNPGRDPRITARNRARLRAIAWKAIEKGEL